MNRLLLTIVLFVCSVWLHAQLGTCRSLVGQAEQIKLSECSGKSLENRNEIFSYQWDSNDVLHIIHKDVLVLNSNSDIEIEVRYSNDSILISEKASLKEESRDDDRCLKDLSYQINMADYIGLSIKMFIVLVSDISSIHRQTFLAADGYNYQITGKLDYQYQPLIMDGACEWITPILLGEDGLRQIISNQDTLILGKSYKKIFSNRCSTPRVQEYVGAIREEDKQVFFVDKEKNANGQIAEQKIYDFNLKIGDRIELANNLLYSPDTLTYEVAFIDTIQVENTFRRKFYFYDKRWENRKYWAFDSWLEGIGGEYDLTHFAFDIPTRYLATVAGVWHNDKVLYCRGYGCRCDEILPILEHTSIPDFRILQNPVKNRLLSIALNDVTFSKLDFYSFDGQLKLTKELNTKDTTIEVPLTGFQAGNYILILTRKDRSRESCKVVVL